MKRKYTKKEMKAILKSDIDVPVIVTEQVADTLTMVCNEYDREAHKERIERFKMRYRMKQQIAAGFVICLLCSGITVTASVLKKWNEIAAKDWHIGEEMQNKTIEDRLVTFPDISATAQNVTISVEQVLTDGFGEYVLFKIETPKEIEISADIDFGECIVWTDRSREEGVLDGISHHLMTRLDKRENAPMKINEEKNIGYYVCQMGFCEKDALKGKELSFIFKDLVKLDAKLNVEPVLRGRWEINLPPEIQENASAETKIFADELVNMEIDDKVSISTTTITPIRLLLKGKCCSEIAYEYRIGNKPLSEFLPYVRRIVMKDGKARELEEWMTVYDFRCNDETEKKINGLQYEEEGKSILEQYDNWEISLNVNFVESASAIEYGIIDPDNIDSIVLEYQGKEYIYSLD